MIDRRAEALKVLLVPGSAFSATGRLNNFMRASFSMVTPSQIEEGMKRFAQMIENEISLQQKTDHSVIRSNSKRSV